MVDSIPGGMVQIPVDMFVKIMDSSFEMESELKRLRSQRDFKRPLPSEPGAVIKYHNRQDSEMIAALDNKGAWKLLCIASPGHIHMFDDYTPEMLEFDIGDAIWHLVK